ncbi:phenylalanine--tRNA ligase subunit alpha [Mycoplasmoides alvi]|uniref:phenylalanine--tRNA ligase subunit alpha n=1 Tax=Mycoplasmoides alvi TaxID=78580 RepID=UPI00051C5BC5|nr:phenylalanine--tRNA ligase subunit alpha [Mycoplasmoides alvi]
MLFNHDELIWQLKEEIKDIDNVRKLYEIKNVFTKKFIKPLFQHLASTENEDQKKEIGLQLKILQDEINLLVENTKNKIEDQIDQVFSPNYDMMLPANNLFSGTNHILQKTIDEIILFFQKFNFKIVNNNELTTTTFCFDVLNIPIDHPGRSTKDTFYVDNKHLLRTQCTASTIQAVLQMNQQKDIRVLSFGNVYRNDTDDATHSHQFKQVDFIWIRQNMSLTNLKWFIQKFISYIFSDGIKTRFRLSYFPFTEPSFEVDVKCWNCQKGCNVCKQSGWIEILGSGLLHPVVIKSVGINSKFSGLAAGIGIERLAMIKHEINDIREFYENDFRFNDQFKD